MEEEFPENQSTKIKDKSWFSIIWLFVFWMIWLVIILVKLQFDSVHYKTIDGMYYQELANDFKNGKPMVLDGILNQKGEAFSPYPPGYPIMLSLVDPIADAVGIPVQVVISGLFFLLVGLIWIRYFPLWPFLFLMFSDTMLELGCYKWSEFPFISLAILTAVLLSFLEIKPGKSGFIYLFLLFVFLFLIRYAAVFFVPFLFILFLVNQKLNPLFSSRLKVLIASILSFLVIFGIWEFIQFGQLTGGDRYPNSENFLSLLVQLGIESGNQFLLFKDWSGSSVASFQFGFAAIILVAIVFSTKIKNRSEDNNWEQKSPIQKRICLNLFWLGCSYLLIMINTRFYFYFAESFDLRLLAPGFSLLLLSAFALLAFKFNVRHRWLIFFFIGFSLFFNLPKKQLFEIYQEKFWLHSGSIFGQ